MARNIKVLALGLTAQLALAITPISTTDPSALAGGLVANVEGAPVSSFFAGLKPPFPTNGWWAPYAATPGTSTAAGPFPYESKLDGHGVLFGISVNRDFDGVSIHQRTQTDWRASFTEHDGAFEHHKALSFDTQAVTLQYFSNGATMNSYLVPGSPYMTFEFAGATPQFTTMNGGIKSFNGHAMSKGDTESASGTEFTVTDTQDVTYLIYALSSINLTAKATSDNNGTVTADGKYNGVLRMVKLADPGHKALLDQHYTVYPKSSKLDYHVSGGNGSVVFTWDTSGNADDLLMLTWPHHRQVMQDPIFPSTSSLGYLTTKGWMYPALGARWTLDYQLSDITWDAPRAVDDSCKSTLIAGLEYEVGKLDPSKAPVPGDFYYWGGTLATVSRLALIADSVGRSDLVDPVLIYLKTSFDYWFQSSSKTIPAYESGWGGVISKAGATSVWVDFGNGFYNDHHFHYGYFLQIAAVIAKYDAGWLQQHKEYINYFARDIINPSADDPYFPIARCVDWFAGHSWASGVANGAGSRDQESSGEGINGYYGAMLWATVALSPDHVDWARLLLAQEIHGSQTYWHLYPDMGVNDRDNPYPEAEARALITMGNVEDWQAGAFLFWGAQRVQIAAIQMLPLTPDKEVLYDQKWVDNMWAYTQEERNDPTISDDWKCVLIAAYSNYHPQEAASTSASLTSWGSGNTFTNELYFISTRNNPSGQPICSSLPSNPYGNYTIQIASSSKFVTASASNENLVATADSSGAAVFNSGYRPNAGTLQLDSTDQYVTADASGNHTISASRGEASSWEIFVIRQKSGAAEGVYSIKASSNNKYITVGGDGELKNNGGAEEDSAGFKFVPA